VALGPPETIASNPESITGLYISEPEKFQFPQSGGRRTEGHHHPRRASYNRKRSMCRSLGLVTVVTGVSVRQINSGCRHPHARWRETLRSLEEPGAHQSIEVWSTSTK
jgi:hypothetical protein